MAVAYHQLAGPLIRNGSYSVAQRHLQRALNLWMERLYKRKQFWQQFIKNYNEGKHYTLAIEPVDLQTRIFQLLAGFCVSLMQDALRNWSANGFSDSSLEAANACWTDAKRLGGDSVAVEVFEEIVDVNALIAAVDPKLQPKRARQFCMWLYDNVQPKKEYQTMAANLVLEQATQCLAQNQVSEFLKLLNEVGRASPELRSPASKAKSMGKPMIVAICNAFRAHPLGAQLKLMRPDMVGLAMLQCVFAFANSNLPVGFGPTHVGLAMDQVMLAVIKNLGK